MDIGSIVALRQERAKLFKQATEVNDKHKREKRAILAEEESQVEECFKQMDALDATIKREERMKGYGDDLGQRLKPHEIGHTHDADPRGDTDDGPQCQRMEALRSIFTGAVVGKEYDLSTIQSSLFPTVRSHTRGRMMARSRRDGRHVSYSHMGVREGREARNVQASDFESGGALIPDQQFETQLLANVDDLVHMRGLATIKTLRFAKSLGAARRKARASDAEWTTELDTGSDDTQLKFARREFRVHPLAKRIRVSETELEESPMNPEAIVMREMAYIMAITAEKAYMTGDGNQKPLGVFVKDERGVGADQDIESTQSLSFKGNDLIDMQTAIKAAYHSRTAWMMHRGTHGRVRKLVDGQGQYLYQPGLQLGAPDLLLARPIFLCEFAPNDYTTAGNYVIVYGDFSQYWIVDSLSGMKVKRLNERYADTNEIGFQWRWEGDGAPALAEAFSRLKLKA